MKTNKVIEMNVNNYVGSTRIMWKPDSPYSVGHYEAFIIVPFQDVKWEHLFIFDKGRFDDAVEKAKCCLALALQNCSCI